MSDLDAQLDMLEVQLLELERRFGAGRAAGAPSTPLPAQVEHGDAVPAAVPQQRRIERG